MLASQIHYLTYLGDNIILMPLTSHCVAETWLSLATRFYPGWPVCKPLITVCVARPS